MFFEFHTYKVIDTYVSRRRIKRNKKININIHRGRLHVVSISFTKKIMCNNWLFHNGRVGSGGRKRLVVMLVLRRYIIYVFVDSVGGLLSGSVAGDR